MSTWPAVLPHIIILCVSNHLHTCWELAEHTTADTDLQKPEHVKYTSKHTKAHVQMGEQTYKTMASDEQKPGACPYDFKQ